MFDDKFINKIDPAGNGYARTMSDKLGGDMSGFRTVTMQTADGAVMLQTKGGGRPQLSIRTDGAASTSGPQTITEVDLSGAKTQNSRLYYHNDENDEYRVWSSDGLLSMRVKPLRRIVFKTSGIKPARTFSAWLCDEQNEVVSAPDVGSGSLPTAIEIAAGRQYFPYAFLYERVDLTNVPFNFADMRGLGLKIARLKRLQVTMVDGVHSILFAGQDEYGSAVSQAGTSTCSTMVETSLQSRTSVTPQDRITKLKLGSFKMELAGAGGVLPFSDAAYALKPAVNLYDAATNTDVTCQASDLSRIKEFGAMYHGLLVIDSTGQKIMNTAMDVTIVPGSKMVPNTGYSYAAARFIDFKPGENTPIPDPNNPVAKLNTYCNSVDGRFSQIKGSGTPEKLNLTAQRKDFLVKSSTGEVYKFYLETYYIPETNPYFSDSFDIGAVKVVLASRYDNFTEGQVSLNTVIHDTGAASDYPNGWVIPLDTYLIKSFVSPDGRTVRIFPISFTGGFFNSFYEITISGDTPETFSATRLIVNYSTTVDAGPVTVSTPDGPVTYIPTTVYTRFTPIDFYNVNGVGHQALGKVFVTVRRKVDFYNGHWQVVSTGGNTGTVSVIDRPDGGDDVVLFTQDFDPDANYYLPEFSSMVPNYYWDTEQRQRPVLDSTNASALGAKSCIPNWCIYQDGEIGVVVYQRADQFGVPPSRLSNLFVRGKEVVVSDSDFAGPMPGGNPYSGYRILKSWAHNQKTDEFVCIPSPDSDRKTIRFV